MLNDSRLVIVHLSYAVYNITDILYDVVYCLNGDVNMESRIIVRISEADAIYLKCIATELGINLSEFVRLRALGKNISDLYMNLIIQNIQNLNYGEEFTLKKLLTIKDSVDFENDYQISHFDFLSRIEKDFLIESVVDKIDEEEISAEYILRKNGKYRFRKIRLYDNYLSQHDWEEDSNEN